MENTISIYDEAILKDYVCKECGATGVKLWRPYNAVEGIPLLCCDCAAKEEEKDISDDKAVQEFIK